MHTSFSQVLLDCKDIEGGLGPGVAQGLRMEMRLLIVNSPIDTMSGNSQAIENQVKDEDEKQWLSQLEMVESRVFQGKTYTKAKDLSNYGDISQEWSREQRRIGKNTTVMIDGFAVNKESLQCADWEAVPTMAGKDPRLAEPKREKKPEVNNQEVCCSNSFGLVFD